MLPTVNSTDPATARRDADWREVCEWIRTQTPANVRVQTPRDRSTFKWYAQRPEYVTYKDCPQDVAGIVEWNRRLQFLAKWYQDHYADGHYSEEDLRDLVRQTGLTHLITDRLGPFDIPPSYENDTYRVYDLTQLAPSS